ncbi:hypothetical protein [Parathalassolituus penaei]|uniref:Uncharacterized protein n=1 Tax=Parathalassolituus penaei TaxID=2997323 RepID=A0A9X3ELR4_9GAMM|nr:hypothetical protein [Parathalassolituus penaei]MCY0966691.1 hypothetical protein [Parathalassolituus penaei]
MRVDGPIGYMQALAGRLTAAQQGGFIDQEQLDQLQNLIIQLQEHNTNAWQDACQWLASLMMFNPQLAPAVDRELLWILGGDCLHYLTDDEVNQFQQQDDLH